MNLSNTLKYKMLNQLTVFSMFSVTTVNITKELPNCWKLQTGKFWITYYSCYIYDETVFRYASEE